MKPIYVIGGGAAGYFAAIQIASLLPNQKVLLLEKTRKTLAKVRISGGGRCNVTSAFQQPKELSTFYPRGEKELLGPFHKFGPKEMCAWLEERGVKLHAERDGRMFPTTNSSQTIIDCFSREAERLGVELRLGEKLDKLPFEEAAAVILATGSAPAGHRLAEKVGHTIAPLAPSLFSFNIESDALRALSGVSVASAVVSLPEFKMREVGPLLITHWGVSGPAVLKLSAWGARKLKGVQYKTKLRIDWGSSLSKRLKSYLYARAGVFAEKQLSKKEERKLDEVLHFDTYEISGKTTNKEEFVTCGGVSLKEVDMRTMRSKLHPNLYFAGEVLDIDGVTGGFNFQAAWTTSFLAAQAVASDVLDQA